MNLNEVDAALETLLPCKKSAISWPNRIGVIGGEPTLHHDFEAICELLLKRGPKQRFGLWTYGGDLYEEYKPLIDKTFGLVAYNEHNDTQVNVCKHQPATLASGELIDDKELLEKVIDNCWVQLNWCPSIAQGKTYFCEVAYGIDKLFNLGAGWDLDYNWFMKDPPQFKDQVSKCCHLCGMPVPFARQLLKDKKELVTPKLLEMMKGNGLRLTSEKWCEVYNKKLDIDQIRENLKTWDPRNYRGDTHRDGTCYGGYFSV